MQGKKHKKFLRDLCKKFFAPCTSKHDLHPLVLFQCHCIGRRLNGEWESFWVCLFSKRQGLGFELKKALCVSRVLLLFRTEICECKLEFFLSWYYIELTSFFKNRLNRWYVRVFGGFCGWKKNIQNNPTMVRLKCLILIKT